jgi:hypothetical protein
MSDPAMIDERTEQLINRKLDGELSDQESLELDKLLIRNPQVRALLEEYARMDEQAGEVIRAVACEPVTRIGPQDVLSWTSAPRHQWWYSFGLVSGVAAAITLAVLLSQRTSTLRVSRPSSLQLSHTPSQDADPLAGQLDYVWNVEGPRRETVNLDRDVIGVWDGESGSLYLLEADSTRSFVEPVRVNY